MESTSVANSNAEMDENEVEVEARASGSSSTYKGRNPSSATYTSKENSIIVNYLKETNHELIQKYHSQTFESISVKVIQDLKRRR